MRWDEIVWEVGASRNVSGKAEAEEAEAEEPYTAFGLFESPERKQWLGVPRIAAAMSGY